VFVKSATASAAVEEVFEAGFWDDFLPIFDYVVGNKGIKQADNDASLCDRDLAVISTRGDTWLLGAGSQSVFLFAVEKKKKFCRVWSGNALCLLWTSPKGWNCLV
jgi:hypothetical protein